MRVFVLSSLVGIICFAGPALAVEHLDAAHAKRSANPNCPYGYGACVKLLMEKHNVLGRDASRRCTYLCSK